jgi:hypothetical protein
VKKYAPIIIALLVVATAAWWALIEPPQADRSRIPVKPNVHQIGTFGPQKQCARPPRFLRKLNIPQPVMIDLSQKRYKGVALLFGPGFSKVLHPKQWEQYEYFSTYAVDEAGNVYLVPTPFISIRPTTFTLQQKLYRLDTKTGRVGIWMEFEDVRPSERNPYGVNAVAYDCRDRTLWVGAIDESDYAHQKGVIYHIDTQTKTVLSRYEGFDALTLMRIATQKGSFLLAGSARDNALYAFRIEKGVLQSPVALFEIPNATERIRKIKVRGPNRLEVQTIPFSYSLIAQTAEHDRTHYEAVWHPDQNRWSIRKIEPE